MMEAQDDEIEVIVQSVLPSGGPQGKFRLKVPSHISVEGLIRRLCKEANAPLLPHYVLRNAKNQVLPSLETLDNVEVTHGSILQWGDEEVVEKSAKVFCNTWWCLSLISLLIGAAGLIAIAVIKSREPKVVYSYGIVFDAGSSHTSMYIYKWNGEKLNETAVASQFGDPVTPAVGGISTFTNDPREGERLMKFCLDQAKTRVPENHWKTTPVYLGATAGMRMLDEVNHTISKEILDVIRGSVETYPFKTNASDIRIIAGEEEGAFSWITSNYVAGIFKVTPLVPLKGQARKRRSITEPVHAQTKGALDLGGASAQITFIPKSDVKLPPKYNYSVELYNSQYNLYTHSFLCYGINEAVRRYRAALIKSQNANSTITDPCAPRGYEVNVTHSSIFMAPCVSGQHAMEAYGYSISLDQEFYEDEVFLLTGSSDVEECQRFVPDHLFNFTQCEFTSCSFNGVYQPHVHGDFYAFSTFYYVTNFLNLTDDFTSTFNLTDFDDAISELCIMEWDEVKNLPASKKDTLPLYCFQSNFINILLTQGYGFNHSNWDNLHFVEKVSNTKVGWSLGFMLSKSNGLPETSPTKDITTVTFVLLAILFGLFIMAAIGFACHARLYKIAKVKRRYSRLAEYGSI